MATQTFDDRGLVLTAPDSVRIVRVASIDATVAGLRAAGMRRIELQAAGDAPLVDALGEAGFTQIDAFDLSGPKEHATRASLGAPAIEVKVARNQQAVVLVATEDGAYHWILPSDADRARGQQRGMTGIRRFELQLGAPAGAPAAGRRSLFSQVARFRTWVLRFIVTEVASRIDGTGPFGLVPMTGVAPGKWHADEVPPLASTGGRPPRILLAVHGTFSSTRTFAPLAEAAEGESFLTRAGRRYDAVLGFDHKTLGDAAETNAADLMRALEVVAPPQGVIVDAFGHSRGGLVLRSAIEALPTAATSRIRFEKVAFVGCPLDGTRLARKENWRALTDLYTTLALAAAKAAAPVAPGTSTAATGLAAVVSGLGRFVQALAESAVEENNVPGLRSMLPGGPLVTALAGATARSIGAEYATISSDFDPDLSSVLRAPLATLKGLLLDRFADDLFRGANDLVVDTASMAALKPYLLGQNGDLALGRNGDAYHTAYFLQAKVVDSLGAWFGLPATQASAAPVAPNSAGFEPARRGPFDDQRFGGGALSGGFPDPAFSRAADVPAPGRGTRGAPKGARMRQPSGGSREAPVADVPCNFAAEMPPSIQVGAEVRLCVTLSREEIVTAAGALAVKASSAVDPDAMLNIRIVAVAGCEAVEGQAGSYPIPAKGAPIRHTAQIKGTSPGRAKVAVDILQKSRILGSLLLEPQVYADPNAAITASMTTIVPATVQGGSLVLRIYEDYRDGKIVLSFIADCDEPSINVEDKTEIPPLSRSGSIDDLTAQIYRGIERYTPATLDFAEFEEEMATLGRELWRQLVPAKVAAQIETHRDKLAAIQVVSDSCRLPWELVRLPGPDAEPLSFAEMGLVRWLPNCPWPGRRLSLAYGTAIRPDYDGTDGLRALPHAIAEVDAVRAILPRIQPMTPAYRSEFRKLLADGDFDVLHFAGHGAAESEVLLPRPTIVLARRPHVEQHDMFQSDAVADQFTTGRRPIVFLNACQAGQASRSFLGIDGFARAFLKPSSSKGAAVFISPLWSVGDLQAKVFAQTFYDQLNRGMTLVEAVKQARAAARHGQEATWLSYTVYGDPFARAT